MGRLYPQWLGQFIHSVREASEPGVVALHEVAQQNAGFRQYFLFAGRHRLGLIAPFCTQPLIGEQTLALASQ